MTAAQIDLETRINRAQVDRISFADQPPESTVARCVKKLTADADAAAIESAFGRERLQRLAGIKREWDPGNLFRMNHNILPA